MSARTRPDVDLRRSAGKRVVAEWRQTLILARVLQASFAENASGDARSAQTIEDPNASRGGCEPSIDVAVRLAV